MYHLRHILDNMVTESFHYLKSTTFDCCMAKTREVQRKRAPCWIQLVKKRTHII